MIEMIETIEWIEGYAMMSLMDCWAGPSMHKGRYRMVRNYLIA